MCRIPKVVLIAPAERHTELLRALASIEYDVTAVETVQDAASASADVAVVLDATELIIDALRAEGLKVVAIGAHETSADMHLHPDALRDFRSRIWELFRPA